MKKYDLIVIGSGPAGEKAAVKAAYFGYRVALVEKESVFGGAGVHTGTLPSKTLKETALFFSATYENGLYGVDRTFLRSTTIEDFLFRKNQVCATFGKEVKDNLERHKVDLYHASAYFEDPHTIRVGTTSIYGTFILIATGSYPFHPSTIPFDGDTIHDSDTILSLKKIPASLCIVGAGVIGCEYATIFAAMGTEVYLVNDRDQILSHVDGDITKELVMQMQKSGIEILFNTALESVSREAAGVCVHLKTGKKLLVESFLFAAGRSGCTKTLALEKAGVPIGKRETVEVDATYRTQVPHIFAVGDVIGFPALASTSMDQGRVAVAHMFHMQDLQHIASVVPYGIYTIPEVSMVGMTEEDGNATGCCTGKARYSDMARGTIMGAQSGFLKLVFTRNTQQIMGVHIIGTQASELIHYGLSLVKEKKSLSEVIGEVFNYPTLHDLYKYAAYDGLGSLSGHKVKN